MFLVYVCSLKYPACKAHAFITVLSMVCLAVPYFSMLIDKRQDFRKKVTELKMSVLIFYTNLSETFLILTRIKRDIVINVQRSSCYIFRF